jgi:type IV fimbrial biogenesis protein FimT
VFKKPLPNKGFTIIELMIGLAVAGILISFAVPSFTASIQNNRMATQINELHAALSLARSEAIKRNNNATVCRSSNGTICTGNWHDGWIVFVDDNSNGDVDAGEEILRVHGAIQGDSTLTFSQTRVIYASNGIARAGSNGTFTLCDSRGTPSARGLVVGLSGRPRMAVDSNDNDIPEDGAGTDLACS